MKMMPQQQEQRQASFHVTIVPGKCCRHCMMMVQAVRCVEPRRARKGQRYRRRHQHQGPQGCGPPLEERRHRARPGAILWMVRTKRQLVALKPRDMHAGRTSSSGEVHRDSQWGRWPSRYEQARKTNNHHDGACCSISYHCPMTARPGRVYARVAEATTSSINSISMGTPLPSHSVNFEGAFITAIKWMLASEYQPNDQAITC